MEDLALDSIAELFQRTDDGQFDVLQTYFSRDMNLDCASEAEVSVALRRLVFSKVNENLFRRYHEADGNLSRIIRNVKDGARLNGDLSVEHHRGQMWVLVAEGARIDRHRKAGVMNLSIAPPEVLESFFSSALVTNRRVRDLMDQLVSFTHAHPFYAPGYPLISLARCIRAAFERIESASINDEPDRVFSDDETEQAVAAAIDRVRVDRKDSYVRRGKVDGETFEAYLSAVQSLLAGNFIYGFETESLYTLVSEYLPGLTESDYRENHRNILEYLTKLVRSELLATLSAHV